MTKKQRYGEGYKSDKRYVRRDETGRIKERDDVGRSLSADRRRKAAVRSMEDTAKRFSKAMKRLAKS